jgi:hypothetical protein
MVLVHHAVAKVSVSWMPLTRLIGGNHAQRRVGFEYETHAAMRRFSRTTGRAQR